MPTYIDAPSMPNLFCIRKHIQTRLQTFIYGVGFLQELGVENCVRHVTLIYHRHTILTPEVPNS